MRESITCLHYDDFQRLAMDIRIEDKVVSDNNPIRVLVDTGAATVLLAASSLDLTGEQQAFIKNAWTTFKD